ncbi:MAG: TIM barrel protein [Gammaproteobacteria bacterium]|nr:TIM barrel protein [Gammaproteobacteria bacterium]
MALRRNFLAGLAGSAVTVSTAGAQIGNLLAEPEPRRRGRIRQGIWKTVFGADTTLSLDDMCRIATHLGIQGFDLIAEQDWPLLRRHGLRPLMVEGPYSSFDNGIIHPEFHDQYEALARPWIDSCARNEVATTAFIGGLQRQLNSEQALDNAVVFFNRIKSQLEDSHVVAGLENINNRYDEPGYSRAGQVFGPFEWGLELVRRVDSPNVKLICDLYHLQMQDGNIARTIRENIASICHFHVAGVPGRNELDHTQEVNFRYIAEVIAATGFSGYVAHEWRPTPGRDPLQSLKQCLDVMDV